MHLAHDDGKLTVEIDDPTPDTSLAELRESLAHDAERLAALGGDMEVFENDTGGPAPRPTARPAEPSVDLFRSVASRPGAP